MPSRPSTELCSESPEPPASDSQCLHEVAELQSLLSRGKVEAARRLAGELQGRWPDSEVVRGFARVLAPPVARVVEGGPGLSRERTQRESAWLREHAGEYPGCWVVLDGDRLIAAQPTLRAAMESADREVGDEVGTLHYIRPEWAGP